MCDARAKGVDICTVSRDRVVAVCAYCVCSGIFARAMGCCWLYNIDALNICSKRFNVAGQAQFGVTPCCGNAYGGGTTCVGYACGWGGVYCWVDVRCEWCARSGCC